MKRFLCHRSAICPKHGYGSAGKMQATIVTYGEVRSWSGSPHGWACMNMAVLLVKTFFPSAAVTPRHRKSFEQIDHFGSRGVRE